MADGCHGAVVWRRASLILCGLAIALACVLVRPEVAQGGIDIDPCVVIEKNCARVRVNISGDGSGTVTSYPKGITCTVKSGVERGDCENWYLFSERTLRVKFTKTAAAGSVWGKPPGVPVKIVRLPLIDGNNIFIVGKFSALKGASSSTSSGEANAGEASSSAGEKESTGSTETALGANVASASEEASGGAATGAKVRSSRTAAVAASRMRAKVGKNRYGQRIVQLRLRLEENVSANLRLIRGKKTLARKHLNWVSAGNRILTLPVPEKVAGGKATLAFTLRDEDGHSLSARRRVVIAGR